MVTIFPLEGVYPFCPAIPYSTMRTLGLQRGCLSYLTLIMVEYSYHYISMDSSQYNRHVLNRKGLLDPKRTSSIRLGRFIITFGMKSGHII